MRKWIFLLLLFLLWGYGVIAAWSTGDYRGQVFMYYREDDAPMQEALAHLVSQEAGKEKYPDITAWTLTGDVLVQNRELGRKKQAECMSVYGSRDMAAFRRLTGRAVSSAGGWPWNCLVLRQCPANRYGAVARPMWYGE